MRRLAAAVLILALALGFGGCQSRGGGTASEEPVIMFAAGVGGIEDGSFNSSIINGLRKGARELKYDLKILQSATDAQYEDNLKAAIQAKPAMIIGVTGHSDQLLAAAAQNPDIHFALIDGDTPKSAETDLPANFVSMNFDNAGGAFLMGVLAASADDTDGVQGFIGGMDLPVVKSAEIGYRAGVKAVAPGNTVVSGTVGSFDDAERAGQVAGELRGQGAGVVFGFAGGSNIGVIESAAAGGYWFIGVDQDQAVVYPQFAPTILCSMVKNVDTAAYDAAKMQMDGSFKGGIAEYGVGNGGITLGSAGGNITPELQAVYDTWQKAVADGSIRVPETQAELDAFGVSAESEAE
ncbi:BMP family ABC transporter substrate-binding protein [Eubacterium sp. 1001713B170207_170306_E7]|uniref:BMP family lipoprotein n=1 Tax=Eubacterium sp. 1001713B170207_170306_E7 TaxID=2787097 RepID=UPI00189ABE0E|nr:BMP family ABC transporter substrate-binding protein [Eubacterium sp. 1001713B170207_170306_E7]